MQLESIIQQLHANANTVQAFLAAVDDEKAHWKASAKQWNMIEVVNHLYDEELLDFSRHLKEALEGGTWSKITPVKWVKEHGYAQRELAPSLEAFLRVREASLLWLPTLQQADWSKRIPTPFGSISAGDVLHAWLAHDFLHIRQLNEIQYAYVAAHAKPYSIGYAGDW